MTAKIIVETPGKVNLSPHASKQEGNDMKKIVILTGSPRPKGNSSAMAEAFAARAEQNGHTVGRFNCAAMSIHGCRACETCYQTGKPCSFDDDFNSMAPAILEADAIVFATPVYWYSFTAQLKAAIDKMYCFVVGGKPFSGKECGLIACCEENDLSALDGVRLPYERMAALNGWTSLGEVLVPGVLNVGDVEHTDGLERARLLADRF